MSQAITTSNLIAVIISCKEDYRSLVSLDEEQNSRFFRAEDCARTLFITTFENRDHFPPVWDGNRQVKVYRGQDAYETILTIVSGLGSKQKGESHSIFNFRRKWVDLSRSEIERPLFKKLERVGINILEDAKFLQKHFLQNSPKMNFLRSARRLSMRHPSEKVLILGDVDKLVKAMAYTIGLTSSRETPGDILVTKQSQRNLLDQLCTDKKMFSHIVETSLETMIESRFDGIEHVFVMSPLRQEIQGDFLEAWIARNSINTDIVIVPSSHIPEMQEFEKIFDFEGSGCINTREIVSSLQAEKEKRRAHLKWAVEGVKKLSYSRYQEQRPLFKEIDKVQELYKMRVEEVKGERESKRIQSMLETV
jgi:hypothetical protein